MNSIKTTKKGNSYWDNNGAYQKEYDALYDELVPNTGEADTLHGELIRAVSRLAYDYFNNGNCNAVECDYFTNTYTCDWCGGEGFTSWGDEDDDDYEEETCDWCGGSGELEEEEEGDTNITDYYENLIVFIEDNIPNTKDTTDKLRDAMVMSVDMGNNKFNDDIIGIYNELCDKVVHYVLTTPNKKRNV